MLIGWVFPGQAPREIPIWILRFSDEKILSFESFHFTIVKEEDKKEKGCEIFMISINFAI